MSSHNCYYYMYYYDYYFINCKIWCIVFSICMFSESLLALRRHNYVL